MPREGKRGVESHSHKCAGSKSTPKRAAPEAGLALLPVCVSNITGCYFCDAGHFGVQICVLHKLLPVKVVPFVISLC